MEGGRASPIAGSLTAHEKHRLKHPLHQMSPPADPLTQSDATDSAASPANLSVTEETVDLADRLQGLSVDFGGQSSPRGKAKKRRRPAGNTSAEKVSDEPDPGVYVCVYQ